MTLRNLIREKKISQLWLCDRLDITRPTMRKYLDHPKEMRIKHLMKLVDLLDVPKGTLLSICLTPKKEKKDGYKN